MKTVKQSDNNIILAIDTSTAELTAAILQNGQCLNEIRLRAERSHSTQLIPSIQKLLSDIDLKMKDLDGIAAGHGPGSYTGVRITVTVAKTLAWTLKIPLHGVSSLEGLSYGLYQDLKNENKLEENGTAMWIIPILNARRGQVYTGLYEHRNNESSSVIDDGIRLMESWIEEVSEKLKTQSFSKQILFVGDIKDFEFEISTFENISGQKVQCFEKPMSAFDIGILALKHLERSEINEPHHFTPNYTQLAEAERNLKIDSPVK
ncbi:tRNA (adenosine(37)-N6)-threonylcarbamoyltransferase complex dimerization subunit type 1 TsaB [Chengkuizengella axinellae]|uniref:tRNA (Adenosine(37)-N6)-threonylcarbamoyltransferase complex dimerization subunit type 1 TsaB n=1 Tax=Chengkuizengella axinellae TaxID=3064388 RepID=A0ABT9J4Y7_9BACL|nr:tRNA (adenosine(37)-N6)-threonylcarbamoyltransferase complex dimerization subunit type 1 TsaB [Chengkuizengella sp. 2205SS18-9]MDP5276654.1 tRNA (adenosine(37)-N6)-threonylcarbamoyltransferase complex dimerization subunit type 1 TsaB [Chengkuizengella sp. 2205SS18-9]